MAIDQCGPGEGASLARSAYNQRDFLGRREAITHVVKPVKMRMQTRIQMAAIPNADENDSMRRGRKHMGVILAVSLDHLDQVE